MDESGCCYCVACKTEILFVAETHHVWDLHGVSLHCRYVDHRRLEAES